MWDKTLYIVQRLLTHIYLFYMFHSHARHSLSERDENHFNFLASIKYSVYYVNCLRKENSEFTIQKYCIYK